MLALELIKLLRKAESLQFDATCPVGQNLPIGLTFLQDQIIHLPQFGNGMLPPALLDKQRDIFYRMTSDRLIFPFLLDDCYFHCYSIVDF